MNELKQIMIVVAVLVASAASLWADIIWSGVQDTHIFMAPNEPFSTNFSPFRVDLDVNVDGHDDFSIGILDPDYSLSRYSVSCESGNSVARGGQYGSTVIPFPHGVTFDSSSTWLADGPYQDSNLLISWMLLLDGGHTGVGPWAEITGYMGVRFEADGQAHFGWVHMTVYDEYPGMTIHSWAYESTPEESIIAGAIPEPASALLAVIGATFMWFLRRKIHTSKHWK